MTARAYLLSAVLFALGAVPAAAGVYSVRIQAGYSDSAVFKGQPFTATFVIDTSIPPDLDMEHIPGSFGFRYPVIARVDGQLTDASIAFYGYEEDDFDTFYFASARGSLDSGEMTGGGCEGVMWNGPVGSPTFNPGRYACWEYVPSLNPPFGGISRHELVIAEVPEPATWGMMIAGFGLVGCALRRRKTALA